jgi:2-methylisocitrate lyase-like PEP mutase family enzyme
MLTISSMSIEELRRHRITLAVFAAHALNAAMGAAERVLREIHADGTTTNAGAEPLAPDIYRRLIKTDEVLARYGKYGLR